jgi:hypothetical protein
LDAVFRRCTKSWKSCTSGISGMSRSGITHAGFAPLALAPPLRRCSASATAAAPAATPNAGDDAFERGPVAGEACGVTVVGSSQSGFGPPPKPEAPVGRNEAGGPGILLPGRLVGVVSTSSCAGSGTPGTGVWGPVGASSPSSDLAGLTSVVSTQAAIGGGAGAAAAAAATDSRSRRSVAVRVEFASKGLKPGFHFKGARVETRRSQAMGQLDDSTCTVPPLRRHRLCFAAVALLLCLLHLDVAATS